MRNIFESLGRRMRRGEKVPYRGPEQVGEVVWNFRSGGYVEGLEKIEAKMDYKTDEGLVVALFARNVAVFMSNPGGEDCDVVGRGAQLIDAPGFLDQEA